jgi:hypothetical protein
VAQIVNGAPRTAGKATGKLVDGSVISVTFQGATITVSIDGDESPPIVIRDYDPNTPNGSMVGLAADQQGVEARWSDFAATRLGPGKPVAPATTTTKAPPVFPVGPTTTEKKKAGG